MVYSHHDRVSARCSIRGILPCISPGAARCFSSVDRRAIGLLANLLLNVPPLRTIRGSAGSMVAQAHMRMLACSRHESGSAVTPPDGAYAQ